MENIKQEVSELRGEMTNLEASMEHLTGLVEILVGAQVNPSSLKMLGKGVHMKMVAQHSSQTLC